MHHNDLSRSQVLGLFVGIAGFFETFAWSDQRKARMFVPESKNTLEQKTKFSQRGKTRIEMEKSATLLASMEALNIGYQPKQIEAALFSIKNWKMWFCKFLESKEDLQLKQACLDNIKLGLKINKPYKCKHANHLLGKAGASALADSIFRAFYDNEVRAFQESGLSPYFSRDFSNIEPVVEYGEIQADTIPRNFVEVCTGPFYLASEDEHANGISWPELMNLSDDEVLDPDMDFKSHVVDYSARTELYADGRREIMHCHNPALRERIVRRFENLAKLGEIAEWHARSLRYWAFLCQQHDGRERAKEIALERSQEVSDPSGDQEWISL